MPGWSRDAAGRLTLWGFARMRRYGVGKNGRQVGKQIGKFEAKAGQWASLSLSGNGKLLAVEKNGTIIKIAHSYYEYNGCERFSSDEGMVAMTVPGGKRSFCHCQIYMKLLRSARNNLGFQKTIDFLWPILVS